MSLDGLRAWIGEVERKLGMRTRVFLVLAVIAVGAAGAAIYLAIDARDNSVSKDDLQALQQQLETQIGASGSEAAESGAKAPLPEAEQEKVAGEGGEEGGSEKGKGGGAGSGGASKNSPPGGESAGGVDSSPKESSGEAATGGRSAKLKELIESVKQQNKEAEEEQAEK